MWAWLNGLISKILGRNTAFTPVATIKDQLMELRPLPMGVKEFHEWSDRIISAACIPGATVESQKFALADSLLHLSPTVAFKEDGYFANTMRKHAINQVADAMRKEIRDTAKARLDAEEAAKKAAHDASRTIGLAPNSALPENITNVDIPQTEVAKLNQTSATDDKVLSDSGIQ